MPIEKMFELLIITCQATHKAMDGMNSAVHFNAQTTLQIANGFSEAIK